MLRSISRVVARGTRPLLGARQGSHAARLHFDPLEGSDPVPELKGKVVLMVNTASLCGLTPQLRELEMVSRRFKVSTSTCTARGMVCASGPRGPNLSLDQTRIKGPTHPVTCVQMPHGDRGPIHSFIKPEQRV